MDPKVLEKAKQYIKTTSIPGLLVLERPTFEDDRGFFREVFHKNELDAINGFDFNGVQMNHSLSKKNVIRGLHAEEWNKVVYPVTGKMCAVIVDIRPDSETFGKYEMFTLDSSEHKALFIPVGMANSVCVLGEEDVNYIYIVDAYWDGTDTRAIAWDDPDLNISWPIDDPIISDRDKNNPTLREMFPEKFK